MPTQVGRIRVVARVRPLIHEDTDLPAYLQMPGTQAECVLEDETRGTILLRKPYYDSREVALDSVLSRDASQSQTYEVVARGVVDAVLEGYNGTVLAYGQTGTGKTHTIYGPLAYWRRGSQPQLELSGIITRAAIGARPAAACQGQGARRGALGLCLSLLRARPVQPGPRRHC